VQKIIEEQEAKKFKPKLTKIYVQHKRPRKQDRQQPKMQGQLEKKQKAIAAGEIEKGKARGEQDRLTLADQKIEGYVTQMLINSGF
jgi:hypothetical protein